MSSQAVFRRSLGGAVASCLILSTLPGWAVEPEAEVLVTASRIREALNDSLWSSTVLTRADIEARQVSSVQELLATVPGVSIGNSGGLGKLTSVFLRGAEADHTLLLVDGVRITAATAGTSPFELVPVEQIERIEIVRGPRSTLYGSDAVGGVIQIFTRNGFRTADGAGTAAAPGMAFSGSVTGASHDTRRVSGEFSAQGERVWLTLGAEAFETNGFNACSGASVAAFAGCFADEPDDDGYRNNAGSIALGYEINDRWATQLRSLIADGKTEFDGSFQNQTEFQEQVTSLHIDGSLNDAWRLRATVGRSTDDQDNFINGVAAGFFDNRRDVASVQFDGTLLTDASGRSARLVAGIDHQREKVASNALFDETSRKTTGVFGELHGALGAWSGVAGARREDNEQFGMHTTGNVALARQLGTSHRLVASWGTAFRAPSFNDLYFPDSGNPNLVPEDSASFELGIDGTGTPLRWSLHAFQTDIDQLITFDFVSSRPQNIEHARIRGAELQLSWRNELWDTRAQLTRLDPVNRNNDNLLPRRSKEHASLDVRRLWSSGAAGVVAQWEGARFDDVANTRKLGSHFTLDLTAEQNLGRALQLQARVANVFDREYETLAFYNQDGRNYSVTVRYRFGGE